MDLELSMVSLVHILGGLDGTIVVESNMVIMRLLGGKHKVTIMLMDNKLTPLSALSSVQLSTLIDTKVTTRVSNILKLDVLGFVSRVQTVNLPGSGVAIATGSTDLVAIELQVLARGDVLEVDFTVVLEGSEHHFLLVVVVCEGFWKIVFVTSWCLFRSSDLLAKSVIIDINLYGGSGFELETFLNSDCRNGETSPCYKEKERVPNFRKKGRWLMSLWIPKFLNKEMSL